MSATRLSDKRSELWIASPSERPPSRAGSLPALIVPVAIAVGLVFVALSFAMSREGVGQNRAALFWAGLALAAAPLVWVALSERTTRIDRATIAVLFGLVAYAVKVLRDPGAFTLSDEFIHLSATQRLVESQSIFEKVPISGAGVASGYPGLHVIAGTVSEVTGISVFVAGLVTIAVARAVLMLALFLLFESISGSGRAAVIGALLYGANANFLFWSAQFSYESLSLPLFAVILVIAVARGSASRRVRMALTASAAMLIIAVIATHHLTSYAVAVTFWLLTLLSLRREWRSNRNLALAVFATVGAVCWFLFVSPETSGYLGYVFERTWNAVWDVAQQGARAPFQAEGELVASRVDQVLAITSLLIVALGLVITLVRVIRRRALTIPTELLLAVAAVGFLALPPLKLFPGAWETANRASNFLFISVAFVLSAGLVDLLRRVRRPKATQAALTAVVLVVLGGGIAQGWTGPFRLGQPTAVKVGDATIQPQSTAVAEWAEHHLPAGSHYAADEISGRQLAIRDAGSVDPGRATGVFSLLSEPILNPFQRDVLVDGRIDYVVVDRRVLSSNNTAGFYFPPSSRPDGGFGYFPAGVRAKFARIPRSSLLYESDDIAVYDVRGLRSPPPVCESLQLPPGEQAVTCSRAGQLQTYAGSDRVLRLPRMRVRLLESQLVPYVDGPRLNVRLQLLNTSGSPYPIDPSLRRFTLRIGTSQIARLSHAADRTDDLRSRAQLPPGTPQAGTLQFRVPSRFVGRLRRTGAALLVSAPTTPQQPHIGLLPLTLDERGS